MAHLLIHGRAAERRGARRLQGAAQATARAARHRTHGARGAAGVDAPDGRDAHRRLGARLHAAGKGRPRRRGRARDRRPAGRQPRLDARLLVSLHPQRPAHARRDRGRLDRRAFPAPAASSAAARLVGRGHARLAQPVCRARVQRLHLRGARDRRHRRGHLFLHHRRDRRAARSEARRRERGRASRSRAVTRTPTKPRQTSAAASRRRK